MGSGARTTADARRVGVVLVVGVGVVAFVLRAWYMRAHPWLPFSGSDNTWYATVARSFADGDWGRVPGTGGELLFSSRFPPGYPLVLAVGQRLLFWLQPYWAQLWTSVAIGTAGAVLTTVLAWRITATAALRTRIVATLATGVVIACHPLVVGSSAALMSEVLSLAFVAAFLVLVDVVTTSRARLRTWIALGVVVTGAAFTRGEGLLLLGGSLVVLVVVHRRERPVRIGLLAVLGSALLVALLWSAVLSANAARPVLMSTNSGSVLLGANCAESLHGDGRGSWDSACPPPPDHDMSQALRTALQVPAKDLFTLSPGLGLPLEAELSSAQVRAALHRIGDDPVPSLTAIPFRWARGVGAYTTDHDDRLTVFEGRDTGLEHTGQLLQQVVVLPLVVLFLIALAWRRSRLGAGLRAAVVPSRLVPAGILVAVWAAVLAFTYGSARFRQPVEPVFALVCGLAVAAVVDALRADRPVGEVTPDR